MQSVKTKKRVLGAVQTVFLCVVAIFFLVPLYLTITNAFKEQRRHAGSHEPADPAGI